MKVKNLQFVVLGWGTFRFASRSRRNIYYTPIDNGFQVTPVNTTNECIFIADLVGALVSGTLRYNAVATRSLVMHKLVVSNNLYQMMSIDNIVLYIARVKGI